MRILFLFALAIPVIGFSQLCDSISPVSFSGFGQQVNGADFFPEAAYLDDLNVWGANTSLGSGVSDDNLSMWSNSDITSFLTVKKRKTIAPNDNVDASGHKYFVEPGFSPITTNDPTAGTGPEANWNILMYIEVDPANFFGCTYSGEYPEIISTCSGDVTVNFWIDFDPCFSYDKNDMYSVSVGNSLLQNALTANEGYQSFGINTNMGSAQIAALNPDSGAGFDAEAEGYYTFAIEVKDRCGNERLWNEITVYVQDSSNGTADADGDGVYDQNEVTTNENGDAICSDSAACNYGCTATIDSGCDYESCSNCSIASACNYNENAPAPDPATCFFPISSAYDCSGNCLVDSDGDGICDANEQTGCLDNSAADGSPVACNYDSTFGLDSDSSLCTYPATNADCNGDCLAGYVDVNGSCVLVDEGCTDNSIGDGTPVACNYDPTANVDDGTCEYTSCAGCKLTAACNYNLNASITDNSGCEFALANTCQSCSGATDGTGTVLLNDSDGDGVCDADEVAGCTNTSACNYDAADGATDDDGSCLTNDALNVCGGTCSADVDADGICDDVDLCTDGSTCNYADPSNGACESLSCAGCINPAGCNYDSTATISATCTNAYGCDACSGETDGSGTVVDNDLDDDGVCNADEVAGCTNPLASNYAVNATDDDGSCVIPLAGAGCNYCVAYDLAGVCTDSAPVCNYGPYESTNNALCSTSCGSGESPVPFGFLPTCALPWACNYLEEGDCEFTSCVGCTVEEACNYDSNATSADNGSCTYDCYGCTNAAADNYDATSTMDDGSCVVSGCTSSGACNYDSTATSDDASCEYTSCLGCMQADACNYDAGALLNELLECTYASGCDTCSGETDGTGSVVDNDSDNDGVCDADEVPGCTDASACNYSSSATDDDGSCLALDSCGVCGGSGVDTDGDGVCDANEVEGCMVSSACNYNSAATDNVGCDFDSCVGCMDASACSYDVAATLGQSSLCEFADGICDTCSGETDGTGSVVDNDSDNDGVCDADEVPGCTDSSACNYSSSATDDDGSCLALDSCGVCGGSGVDTDGDGVCDANEVEGCMVSSACNYNSAATDNVGCDFTSCEGCMDETACSYDEDATASVPSQCLYPTDLYGADHYDCEGVCLNDVDEDGVCDEDEVPGCMISSACNYNSSATDEDASCTYPSSDYVDCDGVCLVDEDNDGVCDPEEVYGCTNDGACNFNLAAGVSEDDGSCEFSSCAGCTIESACNYDVTATLSDNASCTYIPVGWDDCDETICTDSDNDGNCDFDEVEGCLGEFVAPHIVLSGVVEVDSSVADWSVVDYTTSVTDAIGVDGATTWVDYPGRLEDGRYSVTRIYSASDVCGNTSEAGQLLIADDSHASGCTNANATSYDSAAVNDDGSCDYSPACLGDLNLDNIVGTSDLLILLSSFGLDCPE